MKLYVKDHASGRLREALIDPPDYDALLALGYPDASRWYVGARTGQVVMLCPFVGEWLPVTRILHRSAGHGAVEMVDGNNLNLQRGNFNLLKVPRGGGTRKIDRSLRLARTAFEQRQAG